MTVRVTGWWKRGVMLVAVVGGLLLSTIFTLLLVPLVLGMVLDLRAMLGFDVQMGDEGSAPGARAEPVAVAVRDS